MVRRKRGLAPVMFILASLILSFSLVDASVLVTSSGEEFYEFDVDTQHYAIFAVRHVSTDGVSYPELEFYDNPSYSGTALNAVKILSTQTPHHRNLGFIARNGYEMSEVTSTYVKVDWYPGYQYRCEMKNNTDTLTLGESRQGSFYADEIFDCYQVYLETGLNYNFTLELPIGADFDLYLLQGDLASSKDYLAYSSSPYNGDDEHIYHCPGQAGFYCIVVTNPLGQDATYNITASNFVIDDSPIELHQKGANHNAGTGWFSVNTTANTYSLIAAQEITADPDFISLRFFDNPNHLGSPIGGIDHWDGAYVGGDMIFATRLAGAEDFRTYVEVDYTDYFEYRFEVENGESTGLVHINGNSSLQGYMGNPEFVDAYQVTMTAGWDYVVTLEVPPEVDFDLCLLKGDMAHAGNCESMMLTNHAGTDEIITYTPDETGEYLIVVFDREGYESQYGLTVDEYVRVSPTTSTSPTTTTGTVSNPTAPSTSYIPSNPIIPFYPNLAQIVVIGGAFGLGIIVAALIMKRKR